ncbi:MAG TPA: serine hydrolase [Candidatus Acidoferrales bacterium]|nr:serine hydrolase [Candidatus Acidoferrales bacterium]
MSTSILIRRLLGALIRRLPGVAFGALILGTLAAQTPSLIEQRIQRIQDSIPAQVVVKGEPASTTKLADRMAALHVPGVSIAVIHDGKIEWARGFGVTRAGGPPVTPDTLFQAASISKPVAAMAVLLLVQSGKLSLDTDVNQYLKTWKLPANSFTGRTKVTIRELLTHTAGLTVHGFAGYASDAPVPTLLQVLDGEKPANSAPIRVDTEPGTAWRYSGGGYVIAQQLLQDVTGEPFAKLMNDTVLTPIGMAKSTYQQPLPKDRLSEVAMPYRGDGQPVPGGPHVYPEMAPAGLWTTPSDLARYAIEVQRSLTGASNRVLSAAMVHQMLTPGLNQQGLGPGTGGSAQHPYFTHGGANEGYRCNLVAYNDGDGLVVMTNGDNGGQLASDIQRSVAREYGWPDFQPVEHTVTKVDSKILDAYAGVYRGSVDVFMVTREGDQLFVQLAGQPKFPAFPESERRFFLKVFDAQIAFEADSNGRATKLTLHRNGTDLPAMRLDDAEAKRIADESAASAEAAAKRFKEQKPAPGSEAAVRRAIEELRLGRPDYSRMSPAFADVTRQQLPDLKSTAVQLGTVQSVTFKGVGQAGRDIYEVKFEKGLTEFRIAMTPDGKIEGRGFRPL